MRRSYRPHAGSMRISFSAPAHREHDASIFSGTMLGGV
jgi:hypothetical protein